MTSTVAGVETVRRAATRFPGFDGLRAIAALAVAATHAAFISGFNVRSSTWGPYTARLDIGVAVFFVISGFLLYRPFVLARFGQAPAPAPRAYFRRRLLRIYPAFWLALTAVILIPQLHGLSWQRPSWTSLLAHYSLTHIYFRAHVLGPLQQSWTLATEISFYAFLPVYAWVMRHTGHQARRSLTTELAGVVILYSSSVAFRVWLFFGVAPRLNGMYNTWLPARFDLFAVGMFLAVVSAWWATTRTDGGPSWLTNPALPWISWALSALAFWYLSVGFGLDDPRNRGPVPTFSHAQQMWLQLFWGVVGFFLVAPAVFGRQDHGLIRRFLTHRTMAWIGLVSYGVYLWHEAVIDLYLRLTEPVAFNSSFSRMTAFMVASTAVLAAVSYYALERPVLRLKDRPDRRSRAR